MNIHEIHNISSQLTDGVVPRELMADMALEHGIDGRRLSSAQYWEARYAGGGNSGCGSLGKLAEFKAAVINEFIEEHDIQSVADFGCGDGNQLELMNLPEYIGLDVSETAIRICQKRFRDDKSKRFILYTPVDCTWTGAIHGDLTMSLDVIYHLTENCLYELYMRHLFASPWRFLIIYSSNVDREGETYYIKHRRFTNWVDANATDWKLTKTIPNRYPFTGDYRTGSMAEFYIYEKDNP